MVFVSISCIEMGLPIGLFDGITSQKAIKHSNISTLYGISEATVLDDLREIIDTVPSLLFYT